MLEHRDVRVRLDLTFERGLDRRAGRVGRVDDAPMAVATLAGEMEAAVAALVAREGYALRDEPLDRLAAVLDHETRDRLVAQPSPRDQGVVDVGFRGVFLRKYRRDAALGPVAGALPQLTLGDDANRHVVGEMEGDGEPGKTATHHDGVEVARLWKGRVHGSRSYPNYPVGFPDLILVKTGSNIARQVVNSLRSRESVFLSSRMVF